MPAPLSTSQCTSKAAHIREELLALKQAISQDAKCDPGEIGPFAAIVLASSELLAIAARARALASRAEEDMRVQGELTEAKNLAILAEGDNNRLRQELSEAKAGAAELSRQLGQSRRDIRALAREANEAAARAEQRKPRTSHRTAPAYIFG